MIQSIRKSGEPDHLSRSAGLGGGCRGFESMGRSIGMHVQEELLRAMYMFLAQAVELDRLVRHCASCELSLRQQ